MSATQFKASRQIARDIAPEVKEQLKNTELKDNKSALLKVARTPQDKQADRVLSQSGLPSLKVSNVNKPMNVLAP